MPIFRYTFRKILLSPSTWVIFILTLILLFLAWILTPVLATNKNPAPYEIVQGWRGAAIFGFLTLLLLIFIGVKSVQVFRDEIDDGTLLILVSKPISRNRIWSEKWLSFQAIIIGYIFLSIAIPSLFLLIPSIAGPEYFGVLFPYMCLLFGVALIFDLIFSSIILLISLVLNSKAVVALAIGFAALTMIFNIFIEKLIITIPQQYFTASQSVKVYQLLENKIDSDDFKWFNQQKDIYLNSETTYTSLISNFMQKVYKNLITDKTYPEQYDYAKEKIAVQQVADGNAGSEFIGDEDLAKHIINISNVYRTNVEQSYESLMTRKVVPTSQDYYSAGHVKYSVVDTFLGFKVIDKTTYDDITRKIFQKRMMRYFNVFYQMTYLFDGITNQNTSILTPYYENNDDPYLFSYKETSPGSGQYIPDTASKANSKIINLPALISIYMILGISLLGASWYLFNRRDFA